MKTYVFLSVSLRSFGAASSSYSSHSKTVFRHSPFVFFHSSSLSSSTSSASYSSTWQNHDEESKNVKVSVWWDFQSCPVPDGVNVSYITPRITSSLRANGVKGPVIITAFGDVSQLRVDQVALASTGIHLNHVPNSSGKNNADRSFLLDLVFWVSQNPPPVHFFLISGNKDFASALHRLRMHNYNILLASTDCSSGVLCSAASIMFHWNGLVRGDTLIVKHFTHPPDGMHGSWYGHYKGPLDDPFVDTEQSTCTQPEDSPDSSVDSKPRPIPKALVSCIRQILSTYPNGVSLSELRSELGRSNVTVDKDFFGHKKFSRFLLSMPNILQLKRSPSGDGQPLVYGIQPKTAKSNMSNSKTSTGSDILSGQDEHCPSSESLQLNPNAMGPINAKSKSSTNEPKEHTITTELSPSSSTDQATVAQGHKEIRTSKVDSIPLQQHDSTGEEGFFGRIWRTWFAHKIGDSNEENFSPVKCPTTTNHSNVDANSKSCTSSKKKNPKEATSLLSQHNSDMVNSNSRSPDDSKSVLEDRTLRNSQINHDKADQNSSFFNQFIEWVKFWKPREKHTDDSEFADRNTKTDLGMSNNGVNQIKCQLDDPDLFSKSYFWDDMESFFHTQRGLAITSRSMTREELAKNLQKEGPFILKALRANQFRRLVDILISEKKWIEECMSWKCPFKLTLPANKSCPSLHARRSNGLTSIFSRTTSKSDSSAQEGEKQEHNHDQKGSDNSRNSNNKQPQNLAELRAWFQKIRNLTGAMEAKDFKRYFGREFNTKLDSGFYGCSNLESLFVECSADNGNSIKNSKKPSKKSRLEILADCKNLVTEILQSNPEGFNIGSFKPLFFEKYGYVLDHQMLGYSKLMSLLQIMPGVEIESTFILPKRKVTSDLQVREEMSTVSENSLNKEIYSDGETTASAGRANYLDPPKDQESVLEKLVPVNETMRSGSGTGSSHNELGPVTETTHSGSGVEASHDELGPVSEMDNLRNRELSSGRKGDKGLGNQAVLDEPFFSDDEFSESEGEDVTMEGEKGRGKHRGEEESSLIRILDSWHSNQSGSGKEQSQNVGGLADCSRSNGSYKPSPSSGDLEKSNSLTSCQRKFNPRKNYSFVSESVGDNKEKLIDSILDSLQKATDLRSKVET